MVQANSTLVVLTTRHKFWCCFWGNFIVEKQFQSVKFNMKKKMESNNQILVFVEPEMYL